MAASDLENAPFSPVGGNVTSGVRGGIGRGRLISEGEQLQEMKRRLRWHEQKQKRLEQQLLLSQQKQAAAYMEQEKRAKAERAKELEDRLARLKLQKMRSCRRAAAANEARAAAAASHGRSALEVEERLQHLQQRVDGRLLSQVFRHWTVGARSKKANFRASEMAGLHAHAQVMALVAADQAGTLLPLLLQRQKRQGGSNDDSGKGLHQSDEQQRQRRGRNGKAHHAVESPEDDECRNEDMLPAEESTSALASKSNLARAHRLRLMRQVAVQVLQCRRQMTDGVGVGQHAISLTSCVPAI